MAEQVPLSLIARKAKVSPGTVSRVFNNSSLVKEQTRDRILNVARTLGIRPKIRSARNRQIALITEPPKKTVMGGYVSTLTQNICFALSLEGVGMSLITEDNMDSLHSSWFDGIIAVAWFPETVERLKKIKNTPVVWINRNDLKHDFNIVRTDHLETGYMVGKYLLNKGHRRISIALTSGQTADQATLERISGMKKAIEEFSASADISLLFNSEETPLHLFINRVINESYTALWLCNEDMVSLEALWLIQEMAGKKIPEDLSIIGMENPGISEFLRPALTTVAQPLSDMAEESVRLVLNGENEKLENRVFPVKIIERQSVKSI